MNGVIARGGQGGRVSLPHIEQEACFVGDDAGVDPEKRERQIEGDNGGGAELPCVAIS